MSTENKTENKSPSPMEQLSNLVKQKKDLYNRLNAELVELERQADLKRRDAYAALVDLTRYSDNFHVQANNSLLKMVESLKEQNKKLTYAASMNPPASLPTIQEESS